MAARAPSAPSSGQKQPPPFALDLALDCFLSPELPGFAGAIKTTAQDFVVTELDRSGQPVTLDSFDPPPLPERSLLPPRGAAAAEPAGKPRAPSRPLREIVERSRYEAVEGLARDFAASLDPTGRLPIPLGEVEGKEERAEIHLALRLAFPMLQTRTVRTEEGKASIEVLPDPNYVKLHKLLGSKDAEALLAFLNTAERKPKAQLFLSPDSSKEHRTEVHRSLGELYGRLVTTKAHTSEGQPRRKRAKMATDSMSGEEENDREAPRIAVRFWPRITAAAGGREAGGRGQLHTKFVLWKENIETLECLHRMAELLQCQAAQFSHAGTKDRRAVSVQRMSIRGVTAARLVAISNHPLMAPMKLGNFEYGLEPVRLGDLGGNQFTVVVRSVVSHREGVEVEECAREGVRALEERGFVNYFGVQRFGMDGATPVAPLVGLAMLRGEHRAAVGLILQPQGDGSDPVQEAKRYFVSSADLAGTLQRMPFCKTRERLILRALLRHGYTEALMSLPYATRLLYVHSASSLLWNHMASTRLTLYGHVPVQGDLVMKGEGRANVHELTSEDIASQKYMLGDVVLPSAGTTTTLPGNKVGDKLRALLTAAGITLGSFRLRRLGLKCPGAYRRIIAQPSQLSWRWIDSTTISKASVVGRSSSEEACGSMPIHKEAHNPREDQEAFGDHCNGERGNLELTFSLPPSTYATVMLRELMKVEPVRPSEPH